MIMQLYYFQQIIIINKCDNDITNLIEGSIQAVDSTKLKISIFYIGRFFFLLVLLYVNLADGSDGKVSVYNMGDPGSSPGLGRSPGEGNGNPLQYCCLENPMDRGAW